MQRASELEIPRALGRSGLVRLVYRLGRLGASGVLTLAPPAARPEVLVLRRGAAVCADGDLAKRELALRLARLASVAPIGAAFDDVAAYPPGAVHHVPLAGWARTHLESQLDGALAERLVRELAGTRLVLRAPLVPEPLDDADRRMLAALAQPRSLAEVWPLARAPRFRLLAFLHFLRSVGAVTTEATAKVRPRTEPERGRLGESRAPGARGLDGRRVAAARLLGVDDAADAEAVKRAYRRLARAWHPDLQPEADEARRRMLERRFAELTAAYESLA